MVFSFLYLAFRALLGALVRSRRGYEREPVRGRTTIVLVPEALGF